MDDKTQTWLEVMQGYKPSITQEEANYILWNETCYPFDNEIALSQIKSFFESFTP